MYGWEKRVLLREYLEQGVAKGALAKKLGISRNTIHYWLKTDQLDRELDEESGPATRSVGRPPARSVGSEGSFTPAWRSFRR